MSKIEISYEQAVKRLEEIVTALNSGETGLDESLALFEEGTRLTAHCTQIINNAKQKITEIEKD